MDAHALLTSQGWRGTGHSLHPTSDSNGLAKPLLVSQKQNNLGVGKKQHKTSDMWWMNAFDKTLKGLDTSKEGTVVQTVTNGGLDMVVKGGARFVGNGGGLYASFVRGECLSGTITPEESREPKAKTPRRYEAKQESKEQRRERKAAKRLPKVRSSRAEQESQKEVRDGMIQGTGEAEITAIEKPKAKDEAKERKRQKKLSRAKADEELSSKAPKKNKRRKD